MGNMTRIPGKECRLRDSVACNEDLEAFLEIAKKEIGKEGDIVLASLLST